MSDFRDDSEEPMTPTRWTDEVMRGMLPRALANTEWQLVCTYCRSANIHMVTPQYGECFHCGNRLRFRR
jgi:hypothetical protein